MANDLAVRLRRALPTLLFLLLCAMEADLILRLLMERRVPAGHDGYQYFLLQYYFLNGAVMTGEAPQWIPFMTHGTVGTWWFALQAGPIQLVLLPLAPLLRGVNFLSLYYAGVLIEHLLLLTGTWLLCRRFFASPLVTFFIAASVLGSSVWVPQMWHNLHFYYAVPLILHLGHRYLETGRRLALFGALHLLALQTLGNLPYAIPVTTFFIACYFGLYLLLAPGALRALRARLRLPDLAVLALGAASFAPALAILQIGVSTLRTYNPGRTAKGISTLKSFLVYAGNTGRERWVEMLVGVSPALDYTLYIGVLALPLLVVALLYERDRRRAHLALVLVPILLLLGSRSFATLLYHAWPLMKYYRHLILASCFARLSLCFIAGMGLDVILRGGARPRLIAASVSAIAAAALGAGLLRGAEVTAFLQHLVDDDLGHYGALLQRGLVEGALWRGLAVSGAAAVLLLLAGWTRWARGAPALISLLLCLHAYDLYAYKRAHLWLPTVAYSEAQWDEIMSFQAIPYRVRRGEMPAPRSPRAILNFDPEDWNAGAYWVSNVFFFVDELEHGWRAENWLDPLDDLMRAFWRQPLWDKNLPPKGYVYYKRLDLPPHPALRKIAGADVDKIQFFARAYAGDDAQAVAERLAAPDSTGDMLFVADAKLPPAQAQTPGGDRLVLPYQVERFDADHITIRVRAPHPAWMLYADVWHPHWHGRVNGAAQPVYKGNLAYKAVPLQAGVNRVELWFDSPGVRWLRRYFSLCALAWLILLGRLIARILRPAADEAPLSATPSP